MLPVELDGAENMFVDPVVWDVVSLFIAESLVGVSDVLSMFVVEPLVGVIVESVFCGLLVE